MQERIIRSILAGQDAAVVMPTGGGKSLCYQLPAVVSSGTAIVISPLIALMQDQAAQLAEMGIAAAVLNSSVPWAEQSNVIAKAAQGAYRLLYLSPERLAKPETVAWLSRVPVAFFAIDEAHCISEWGHEFRPEYRQLSTLRANFPGKPIAAFTASPTQRVRHDILAQLQLHDTAKYICSFHRPNLQYLVRQCENSRTQARLLLGALRANSGDNVIVYAPTIARVEETVDFLAEKGIAAVPYHAKMDSRARQRNQERWMSDDVRVLVGTIAFGLGINKAAVRAVIHLSLPKSVEQYYQEAGRAGRDGLPADCLLLWQKKDAGLLAYFIGQIGDAAEKERSWQRYHVVRHFVESGTCRHLQICSHFGETTKWKSCGACDVCGATPQWLAEPVQVQRPKRRAAAAAAGSAGSRVIESSTGPVAPDADHDLREFLREWRRTTAREQGVAAFIIMHDTSLAELCRARPGSLSELRRVPGFGERKTELYGQEILDALGRFRNGARAAETPAKSSDPAGETLRLLEQGRTLAEVAQIRGRQLNSVVSLVAGMVERGDLDFEPGWIHGDHQEKIEQACARLGTQRYKPLKEALPEEITYAEIHLVVAHLRQQQAQP